MAGLFSPKPMVTFVLTVYLFIQRTVTGSVVSRLLATGSATGFGPLAKTTSESASLR